MRAGRFDRRIELLCAGAAVDDGYTTRPGEWESQGFRAARYVPAMAKEIFENAGNEAKMPTVFEVRFDSLTRTIDATWRLVFEGTTYEVKGVQQIGRRDGLRIEAVANDDAADN